MGPCIVSIFQYISNKMQRYKVYLYLETALHVSGGTSTHNQERIQLYLQHLVFVTPLLLSARYPGRAGNGPSVLWVAYATHSTLEHYICLEKTHDASFLNRARNSRCTVITDLDTSKRSTQKAFPCCDAILETGPAAPQ